MLLCCVCGQSVHAWFCSLVGWSVGLLFVSLFLCFFVSLFVCLFVCFCLRVCVWSGVSETFWWNCMPLYAPYCPDGACLTCALAWFLHADLKNSYSGPVWICLDDSGIRYSHHVLSRKNWIPSCRSDLKLGKVRLVRNCKAQQWHLRVQALQGERGS